MRKSPSTSGSHQAAQGSLGPCPSSSLLPSAAAAESCRGGPGPATPVSASLSRKVLKGMKGALTVHSSPSLSRQEMVCGVRSPYIKKKSLHIYKCQNKYLRQTSPPLKHMRNHPANCSQDSLQGLREKSNDYTTGQPARLPSHFLMLLKPAAHWEGGGRASEAEHQHATVLERNVMV